jgi:hypothetical protein
LFSFILGEVSLLRGCAGFFQGLLGEFHVMHGACLFGLLNVSQAGLEPVADAAAVAAHKFFSV